MLFLSAMVAMGCLALGLAAAVLWQHVHRRGLHRWVPSYLATLHERPAIAWDREELDVFLAVCDHFEPEWGAPSRAEAVQRVRRWLHDYPERFAPFRDSEGRPPQHTFFFPQDQYQPEYLDLLAELCGAGYGEVEVHLHHDRDTAEGLREKLDGFRQVLHDRHGLLRRDPVTGEIVYGFIHGNWCLCNSRSDGRWCGVDHELPVLLETGCYADFTMPSAPSETQTRTINRIYYASDTPFGRGAHATGPRATVAKAPPPNSLLMIQGPLLFDWGRCKGGVFPRVENGDLLGNHPPTLERFRLWLRARVTVVGQPNWRFVKLHTHGCKPSNTSMLLGEAMTRFHRELAEFTQRHPNLRLHYVTAWEMAQKVHEAEFGATPQVKDRLSYV